MTERLRPHVEGVQHLLPIPKKRRVEVECLAGETLERLEIPPDELGLPFAAILNGEGGGESVCQVAGPVTPR
jgi:hypothetical protein